VTTFPYASLAVTVIVNGAPLVWSGIMSKAKLASGPGLTVNELLVPVLPALVVVIVMPACAFLIVTLPVQTPLVKAPVTVGLMVPVLSASTFVPE